MLSVESANLSSQSLLYLFAGLLLPRDPIAIVHERMYRFQSHNLWKILKFQPGGPVQQQCTGADGQSGHQHIDGDDAYRCQRVVEEAELGVLQPQLQGSKGVQQPSHKQKLHFSYYPLTHPPDNPPQHFL